MAYLITFYIQYQEDPVKETQNLSYNKLQRVILNGETAFWKPAILGKLSFLVYYLQ